MADNTLADIVIFLFQKYNTNNKKYHKYTYGFKKENFPNLLFNYHSNPNNFLQSFNPAARNKLFHNSFIKKSGLNFQNNKRADDIYFPMTSFVSAEKIFFR